MSACGDPDCPVCKAEDWLISEVPVAAECLDELRPGWAAKIDVERLNMGSGDDCIAGQITADSEMQDWYTLACEVREEVSVATSVFAHDGLKSYWVEQIQQRIGALA